MWPESCHGAVEKTVESAFFPGTRLPADVEASLSALLSRDTVRWIEEQETEGRGNEGGYYRGQYISPDMKELIRGFVERHQPERPNEMGPPLLHTAGRHRERGTDVGHPCYDPQKRRTMDHECRPRRASASASFVLKSIEKWLRQLQAEILHKDFLLMSLSLVMAVLSVAALLFVYGVSDLCQALLRQWQWLRSVIGQERVTSAVQGSPRTSMAAAEQHVASQHKSTARLGAKLKARDSSKSTSKRRPRSQSKGKHEGGDGKREIKVAAAHAKAKIKGISSEEGATAASVAAAADANNEWKEVMHNKPKGRTPRVKQEEEKVFPQTAAKKLPPSQPVTPKTPPQLPPAVPNNKTERDALVKPIKTRQECSDDAASLDEPTISLQMTMTSSGAFSDETCHSGRAFCSLPCGEPAMLQQSPVQQSPFASSMDLPFSSSYATEEQVQSKIDCLLRNLRNKPFFAYPVTQSPLHPIRRSATDIEDQMITQRRSQQLPSFLGGSLLDPTLSSSGALNNRMSLPNGYAFGSENPQRSYSGLPPMSLASRMQQRAGSLPLTSTHSMTGYLATRRQGHTLPVTSHAAHYETTASPQHPYALSKDCSLFSSNPSIWSVDLVRRHRILSLRILSLPRRMSIVTS